MALLKSRGMTVIPEAQIDMKAFKAAGEAAYVKLNLQAARDKIYAEMGKTKEESMASLGLYSRYS